MLHWILRHTTDLGPGVALDGVLVVRTSGLQERLVQTSSTSDHANLGTNSGRDSLLSARGETQAGSALVLVVGDDDGEAARAAGKGAAITDTGLNVAHDGTLGHLLQRQDVADVKRRLLATVDELASIHTLSGDHELGVALESVRVQELDLGHRGATPGVVEDLLDHAAHVATALGVVDRAKLDGALAGPVVGLEDGGLTLSLGLLWVDTINSFHESMGMHYPLTITGSRMASHITFNRAREESIGDRSILSLKRWQRWRFDIWGKKENIFIDGN